MKSYELDTSGALRQMFARVLERYPDEFPSIESLHFLLTWKNGLAEKDKEGQWLAAQTKKLAVRERDVYGKDVEICVHRDTWLESSKKQRARIMFHEMLHVNIFLDEELQPQYDDDGRVKFALAGHDVRILTFERELEIFGMPAQYKSALRKLQTAITNGDRK